MRSSALDWIVEFSARQRFLILLIAAAAGFAGWQAMLGVPLDALPDLSDKQVIVYSRWDRSPDLVDAEVTYPIVSALLGAPHVRAVRAISDFGTSLVYVIFDDDTDIYWARSRTQEYLASVLPRLPEGVKTELGPDATSLGWVFQYVLLDRSGKQSLADLRSWQDWYLAYWLKSVPGVAEVASLGGFVKQYQVNLDPDSLRTHNIPIRNVVEALQSGNANTGGRVMESGGAEYMVRGLGAAHSVADLENTLVSYSTDGNAVRIGDVAQVGVGSDFRRGFSDLDGLGEVVSGIVVMRQGENTLAVTDAVKAKLREIQASLPAGVEVVPIYDRSMLVRQSIGTLKWTLVEAMITVTVVILFFLWNAAGAAVPVISILLSVLIAFIPFRYLGISANIMSLGGIAIAVGALVDAAIVMVEQVHKRLEEQGESTGRRRVIVDAAKQVAGPSFFALLVIAVALLPLLTLESQEGRLFRPMAYATSLSLTIAAVLAITLGPALLVLLFDRRGRIQRERDHLLTPRVIRFYESTMNWALGRKVAVAGVVAAVLLATIPVWFSLGTEFTPEFDEGSLLYMPTTMPTIPVDEAQHILQLTDRILKQFPEVEHVLGKAGRAGTSTDSAPLSMLETLVILKPMEQWPRKATWYSSWAPDWLKSVLRHIQPDHASQQDLIARMNEATKIPGVANAWTMPIRGRVDMLSTGIRTPIGLKVSGPSVAELDRIGGEIESLLRAVPGTRRAYSERTATGYFIDVAWNREALARYGLQIGDAEDAVRYAIGGENVAEVEKGRERYPINVRYARDFRNDIEALGNVLVQSADGQRHVPIREVAEVRTTPGPAMLRSENGLLTGYVLVDLEERDARSYIDAADAAIRRGVHLPPGYSISWSGQYEAMERSSDRLKKMVPLALFLIVLLLYFNTRSWTKTGIILLVVPFSAVGAIWLVYLLGYQMSVAVWAGLIALMGIDAETGVFMLMYLDQAYEAAKTKGQLATQADLRKAVMEGACKRVRPKLMTGCVIFAGLLPTMWSVGTGSEIMKHIAAPMMGGILTSFLFELVCYPLLYHTWKSRAAELAG